MLCAEILLGVLFLVCWYYLISQEIIRIYKVDFLREIKNSVVKVDMQQGGVDVAFSSETNASIAEELLFYFDSISLEHKSDKQIHNYPSFFTGEPIVGSVGDPDFQISIPDGILLNRHTVG